MEGCDGADLLAVAYRSRPIRAPLRPPPAADGALKGGPLLDSWGGCGKSVLPDKGSEAVAVTMTGAEDRSSPYAYVLPPPRPGDLDLWEAGLACTWPRLIRYEFHSLLTR